jgi:hypothetical protein
VLVFDMLSLTAFRVPLSYPANFVILYLQIFLPSPLPVRSYARSAHPGYLLQHSGPPPGLHVARNMLPLGTFTPRQPRRLPRGHRTPGPSTRLWGGRRSARSPARSGRSRAPAPLRLGWVPLRVIEVRARLVERHAAGAASDSDVERGVAHDTPHGILSTPNPRTA